MQNVGVFKASSMLLLLFWNQVSMLPTCVAFGWVCSLVFAVLDQAVVAAFLFVGQECLSFLEHELVEEHCEEGG